MRTATGATGATLGVLYLVAQGQRSEGMWAVGLALSIGGAALVLGFLTPAACITLGICMLGIGVAWFPGPPSPMFEARLVAFGMAVTAAGVALIGPGAYSVDSLLFGRREIVIPPRHPQS